MLGIKQVGDLADVLDLSPRRLYRLSDRVDEHVAEYELHNPEKDKVRNVISPQGLLRRVQNDLLRRVFRRRLRHSRFSFGGVPGRSARSNAARHIESRFAFTTDLADFFPSISWWRVEHIFVRDLHCSPEVGRILARLCTHGGHLAQGLITSPLLADYAVRHADIRIAGLCAQHAMEFTRFVDDITVSGRFPLDRDHSGLVALIRRILTESEFTISDHKERSGPIDDPKIAITGLRIVGDHLDVTAEYVERLVQHLIRHQGYARGEPIGGPLFTRDQLAGRIDYVCNINCEWKRKLKPRLGSIDWPAVMTRAADDGLMTCRKRLVRKPEKV